MAIRLPYSGKVESLPYSLSRWTDVPGSPDKWAWFLASMAEGKMQAFDPRTAVPVWWSLAKEDTLALNFWTKNPGPLLEKQSLLDGYNVKVHVTVTGWEEVEKGAPSLREGGQLLRETALAFGAENVVWRFSPVPLLQPAEVLRRFETVLDWIAGLKLGGVYLSFLQTNDRISESRSKADKIALMADLAELSKGALDILLCNEDRTLLGVEGLPSNLKAAVCAPPESFGLGSRGMAPSEGCGCALMVDPFTFNESCRLACSYCYSADKTLSPKKHNTTPRRHLPVAP